MATTVETEPGYKVVYHTGKSATATYGGDGFMQPAMSLTEAQRLQQSLSSHSGLSAETFELLPLGEVEYVKASGPSRPLPVWPLAGKLL